MVILSSSVQTSVQFCGLSTKLAVSVCFPAVLDPQTQRRGTLHNCGKLPEMSSCSHTGHSDSEIDNLVRGSIVHEQTWYCIFSVVYQPLALASTSVQCLRVVLVLWIHSRTRVKQSGSEAAARPCRVCQSQLGWVILLSVAVVQTTDLAQLLSGKRFLPCSSSMTAWRRYEGFVVKGNEKCLWELKLYCKSYLSALYCMVYGIWHVIEVTVVLAKPVKFLSLPISRIVLVHSAVALLVLSLCVPLSFIRDVV